MFEQLIDLKNPMGKCLIVSNIQENLPKMIFNTTEILKCLKPIKASKKTLSRRNSNVITANLSTQLPAALRKRCLGLVTFVRRFERV